MVLIQNDAAIPIDLSLGAMPFEERAAECASDWPIQEGSAFFTCSAEDLIVHKAFADREKDWLDIEGVAVRQAGALDEWLIWRELDPLLELKGSRSAGERLTGRCWWRARAPERRRVDLHLCRASMRRSRS